MAGTVDEWWTGAQAEIYEVTERRASEDYIRIEDLLEISPDEMNRDDGQWHRTNHRRSSARLCRGHRLKHAVDGSGLPELV
jgi:hypothetical protein